jgi:hypothetical protein
MLLLLLLLLLLCDAAGACYSTACCCHNLHAKLIRELAGCALCSPPDAVDHNKC